MGYEFLEHTADVKFRAEGSTIEEMFIAAAEALAETVRGDIKILEQEEKSFEVEGKDKVGLLYNFLEEFLFLLDAEDYLVARIESIEIDSGNGQYAGVAVGNGEAKGGYKLKCVVVGDAAKNYKFTNDVKAVTYSDMFVREGGGDLASKNISTQMNTDEHRFENEGGDLASKNISTRILTEDTGSHGLGKGKEKRFVCEVVLDV